MASQISTTTAPRFAHHPSMAKRKRASAVRGFSSLTIANLERLQAELLPPAARPTRSGVPSATNGESQREKLFDYGIHIDEDVELPETLQDHVNALKQPRNVAPSPNAKIICQSRGLAALEDKATGTALILPYMLFSGEANQENRVEAVPLVTSRANLLFNRHFLPPPVRKGWTDLHQPNPDTCRLCQTLQRRTPPLRRPIHCRRRGHSRRLRAHTGSLHALLHRPMEDTM